MRVGEIWKGRETGNRVRIVKITYHPPCNIIPYSWDNIEYEWVDRIFWHCCGSEEFLRSFEKVKNEDR